MATDLTEPTELAFGPYRLDSANARLLKAGRPVAITPKALDVLQFLASRPDRLVTKDELLSAVWPDVIVGDASIKVCVREIRKALDDGARAPTYIETVHRRGYRFIAPVERPAPGTAPIRTSVGADHGPSPLPASPRPWATSRANDLAGDTSVRHPLVIGREAELARLSAYFEAAVGGRRQLVFITGGPGSGKTALVDAFLRRTSGPSRPPGGAAAAPMVLTGSCFEQFGTGQPYLPIWEAVARGAREYASPALARLAERHGTAAPPAPKPAGTNGSATATEPRGMSHRVLQEIIAALDDASSHAPVVLVVEDIHWADYSTIDLLSALSRRREPVRLMVVATYRPAEPSLDRHPLRAIVAELATAKLCCQLPLETLGVQAVSEYLDALFPGHTLPASFGPRLHQRTEGNPLFLARLLEDLIEQGVISEQQGSWGVSPAGGGGARVGGGADDGDWVAVLETQVPKTVRAVIEVQLERLDEGQQSVLEAGAVAGVEFSAAAAAAALGGDVVRVEQACDELARRHRFLEPDGSAEWPDGTLATRYRFAHDLNHNVVYERIPVAKRSRLHETLGLRMEKAWGERADEEAAALATHFEIGRDWTRAVKYLRTAAEQAARQYGHREAADYLRRASAAVDRLPVAGRERDELPVLMSLAVNLQVTRGFAAPEVERILGRALAMCDPASAAPTPPDARSVYAVLWGSWVYHKVRSDLHRANELAVRLLILARDASDVGMLLQAHQAMAMTHLCLGNPRVTVDHMNDAAVVYDARRHSANTLLYGQDPGVATLAFGAIALCVMGRQREALEASAKALALARSVSQPSSLAVALHFSGMLHQLCGLPAEAGRSAQAAIDLAEQERFSFWHAGSTVVRGWARASLGTSADAVTEIRRGLNDWAATGSLTYRSYYLGLLGDALLSGSQFDEALSTLDDALVAAHDLSEGLYEAELNRLRGRCLGRLMRAGEAEAAFERALMIARAQGARAFELRAAADLASHLNDQGRPGEAQRVLTAVGGGEST